MGRTALWRSEFRNVLALYLRRRHVTLAQALEIQETAEALLVGREYPVDSHGVLKLADESGRPAYDCEFVAVARALAVPLITSDRHVSRAFQSTLWTFECSGPVSGPGRKCGDVFSLDGT